jgi:hypothetical protein
MKHYNLQIPSKLWPLYDTLIYYDENKIVCVCVCACARKILKLICWCYLLFMLLKYLKTIESKFQMFCLVNYVNSFVQTSFFFKSLG